jgi:hypothetical protein
MASSDIIKDIAQQIASRRALYDGAYRGDLDRPRAVHGPGAVLEALQTLERRPSSSWDQAGHARQVERGIASLLQRRQQDPEGFDEATKI